MTIHPCPARQPPRYRPFMRLVLGLTAGLALHAGMTAIAAPTAAPAPGSPWTSPSTGMEFVWIGEMDLWVGKYEVTNIAGFDDGHPVTSSVEESGQNDWGLYGVGGNTWEITAKADDQGGFAGWRGASWADGVAYTLRGTTRNDGYEEPAEERVIWIPPAGW